MKWSIRKWHKHKGWVRICASGFHVYKDPRYIFRFYLHPVYIAIVKVKGKSHKDFYSYDSKEAWEQLKIDRIWKLDAKMLKHLSKFIVQYEYMWWRKYEIRTEALNLKFEAELLEALETYPEGEWRPASNDNL